MRLFAGLAFARFPPADDGVYYDTLARHLAEGRGFTWLWPDGAVTPVVHYPVGYPALLSLAYRAMGQSVVSAVVLHALVGAIGAACVHALVRHRASRRAGLVAGLAVALHPGLVMYAPAVMTEGVCSALVAVPFALALGSVGAEGWGRRAALAVVAGVSLGVTALVRPQALLLAPLVAWLAVGTAGRWRRLLGPALVVAGTLLVLAPWAVRNQRAFGRPVLVSANGGWNLLIGTDPQAHGGWRALEAPPECREVWGEADKDACFGRAAVRRIEAGPWAWMKLAPAKLEMTFDLGGSGPSYLSRSRPDLVSRGLVLALGGVETLFERLALGGALVALGLEHGARRRARLGIGLLSCIWLLFRHAWPAYLGLVAVLALGDWRRDQRQPVRLVTHWVVASTLATHAVFFGAGRYGLLVLPWVVAVGCAAWLGGGAHAASDG